MQKYSTVSCAVHRYHRDSQSGDCAREQILDEDLCRCMVFVLHSHLSMAHNYPIGEAVILLRRMFAEAAFPFQHHGMLKTHLHLVQLYQAFKAYQVAQYGIGDYLLGSATFWFSILIVYLITLSLRMIERAIHSIWFPSDIELLAEHEHLQGRHQGEPLSAQGTVELRSFNGIKESHPESSMKRNGRINSSDESWIADIA